MGTFADFKWDCAYEVCGRWGIGMNPIYIEQKICLTPALCRNCREMVNVNENAKTPKCPKCDCLDVILYSDPSLGQVRRKSVIKTRPVYRDPVPNAYPEPVEDAQSNNPDLDDDGLDIDDLLGDEIEEEDYICGVDTTYYFCPKYNHYTLEKSCCGLFD